MCPEDFKKVAKVRLSTNSRRESLGQVLHRPGSLEWGVAEPARALHQALFAFRGREMDGDAGARPSIVVPIGAHVAT